MLCTNADNNNLIQVWGVLRTEGCPLTSALGRLLHACQGRSIQSSLSTLEWIGRPWNSPTSSWIWTHNLATEINWWCHLPDPIKVTSFLPFHSILTGPWICLVCKAQFCSVISSIIPAVRDIKKLLCSSTLAVRLNVKIGLLVILFYFILKKWKLDVTRSNSKME